MLASLVTERSRIRPSFFVARAFRMAGGEMVFFSQDSRGLAKPQLYVRIIA